MSAAGTIELLARGLAEALAPLEQRLSADEIDGFLGQLGFQPPPGVTSQAALRNALDAAAGVAKQLSQLLPTLVMALHDDDTAAIVSSGAGALALIAGILAKLDAVGTQLGALAGAMPGVPAGVVSAFAADLPKAILERAIVERLEQLAPSVTSVLALAGIVDRRPAPEVAGNPASVPFEVKRLGLKRIIDLLRTPVPYAQGLYGWGSAGFNGTFLLQQLEQFAGHVGLPALLDGTAVPPTLDMLFFDLAADPAASPAGLQANLRVPVAQDFHHRVQLSPFWYGEIDVKGKLDAGLVAKIAPPASVSLAPSAGTLAGGVSISVGAEPTGDAKITLLGIAGGTRLEADRVALILNLPFAWDAGSGSAHGEPQIKVDLAGLNLVLDLSAGDGFIKALTGGSSNSIGIDLSAEWSPQKGLQFSGSSTFTVSIPTHIVVGPALMQSVTIGLGLEPGRIPVELSATIAAQLGPISAVVERIGLIGDISFPEGKGNLGPVDVAFRFKPPTGVGLSVDVGIIKGGGFLSIDADKGEYVGAMDLDFIGIVSPEFDESTRVVGTFSYVFSIR